MRQHILPFVFTAAIALSGISCDDATPPQPTERWVYYAVGSNDGVSTARTGLFRYGIHSRRYERVTPMPIDEISGVAANGVVVMLSSASRLAAQFNPLNTLYGRCENGSVIPVPFPVHPDPRREYAMYKQYSFGLAYNGHHAAYPVVDRPVGDIDPDTTWKSGLVLFNCTTGTMQILPVDSFAQANYGLSNPRRRLVSSVNGDVLLARDAKTLYFTLELRHLQANGSGYGSQLVRWRDGAFTFVDSSLDMQMAPFLRGWDETTGVVYACMGWRLDWFVGALVPGNTTWTRTDLDPSVLMSSQFAMTRSRLVVAGQHGIELRNPSDGSVASTVLAYPQFLPTDIRMFVQKPARQIDATISPDGEWIACTVVLNSTWPDLWSGTRLYVFRADGSDVRFIAQDTYFDVAISDEIRK